MDNFFERKYHMRTADFDRYGEIRPSSLLDLFQDVAGLHANALGCGRDSLIERQMIWVIVRVKLEIVSSPMMFQAVTVKTWPLAPTRAGFRREYLIESENGEVLVKGASEWVVIHSEKRRMVSAVDVYPEMNFKQELAIDEKLSKIRESEGETKEYEITPQFSDIDINGHVNNTKYADFVLDAISPKENEKIKTLQIDYRHEVYEGKPLGLKLTRDGNETTAFGCDKDGNVMFGCKVGFEKIE